MEVYFTPVNSTRPFVLKLHHSPAGRPESAKVAYIYESHHNVDPVWTCMHACTLASRAHCPRAAARFKRDAPACGRLALCSALRVGGLNMLAAFTYSLTETTKQKPLVLLGLGRASEHSDTDISCYIYYPYVQRAHEAMTVSVLDSYCSYS